VVYLTTKPGAQHLSGKTTEDPGLDGRIILGGFSRSGMWGHGLVRSGSGQGQVRGTCKRGNELSGSIKRGEFID